MGLFPGKAIDTLDAAKLKIRCCINDDLSSLIVSRRGIDAASCQVAERGSQEQSNKRRGEIARAERPDL
jgi:hypothetical protein